MVEIRMEIYASIVEPDLRGVFRVWLVERKLFRGFKFRMHDYQQRYHRFEVSHNDQEFISLQVSGDPDDQIANKQSAELSPGRSELMFLMSILLNQALEALLTDPRIDAARKMGLRALFSGQVTREYETTSECERYEAVSSELFVLPDTVSSDMQPPRLKTH